MKQPSGTRPSASDAAMAIEHVNAGGRIWIPSYTRSIVITKKTLDKFSSLGLWVIKADDDGRGWRIRSGKGSVYVFANGVVLID